MTLTKYEMRIKNSVSFEIRIYKHKQRNQK